MGIGRFFTATTDDGPTACALEPLAVQLFFEHLDKIIIGFTSRKSISHGAQLLSQFARAMLVINFWTIFDWFFQGNNLMAQMPVSSS